MTVSLRVKDLRYRKAAQLLAVLQPAIGTQTVLNDPLSIGGKAGAAVRVIRHCGLAKPNAALLKQIVIAETIALLIDLNAGTDGPAYHVHIRLYHTALGISKGNILILHRQIHLSFSVALGVLAMRPLRCGYETSRRRRSTDHTCTRRIVRYAPVPRADRTLSASIDTPLSWSSSRNATGGQMPGVPGYAYAEAPRQPESPWAAVWRDGQPHSCCRRDSGHKHTDSFLHYDCCHIQSWQDAR